MHAICGARNKITRYALILASPRLVDIYLWRCSLLTLNTASEGRVICVRATIAPSVCVIGLSVITEALWKEPGLYPLFTLARNYPKYFTSYS